MKKEVEVYVIYEEIYDCRGFVDVVSNAEKALEIIASSDKKLKYVKKAIEVDIDVPAAQLTQRVVHPCKTWEDCHNIFKDCVNCPLRFDDLEFNEEDVILY